MARAVRFTEADEFLAELARDVELIDRRIVRISYLFTPSAATGGAVKSVEILAAYEVEGGSLVRFRRYTGDYWGQGFPRTALDDADAMRQRVTSAVEDLGLEVRCGLFEDANGRAGR